MSRLLGFRRHVGRHRAGSPCCPILPAVDPWAGQALFPPFYAERWHR